MGGDGGVGICAAFFLGGLAGIEDEEGDAGGSERLAEFIAADDVLFAVLVLEDEMAAAAIEDGKLPDSSEGLARRHGRRSGRGGSDRGARKARRTRLSKVGGRSRSTSTASVGNGGLRERDGRPCRVGRPVAVGAGGDEEDTEGVRLAVDGNRGLDLRTSALAVEAGEERGEIAAAGGGIAKQFPRDTEEGGVFGTDTHLAAMEAAADGFLIECPGTRLGVGGREELDEQRLAPFAMRSPTARPACRAQHRTGKSRYSSRYQRNSARSSGVRGFVKESGRGQTQGDLISPLPEQRNRIAALVGQLQSVHWFLRQ